MTRRLAHEFGVYCVWHLSLTKPNNDVALRHLINDLMTEWSENNFRCDDPKCRYCHTYADRFKNTFRNLIGRKEHPR